MKKSLLFVLPLAFALPLFAAGILPAPANFVAAINGDSIDTSWDPVVGAVKYSVRVIAGFDTDAEVGPDVWMDFDFGTGDRTDGLLMSDPSLSIPIDYLVLEVDTDDDGVADAFYNAVSAQLDVKALDPPGKGVKSQNNPFSEEDVFFDLSE